MATPNYGYEKRQRELAKKKKKEEKLRAKSFERKPSDTGFLPAGHVAADPEAPSNNASAAPQDPGAQPG